MNWTGQSWTPEQPRVTADLTGSKYPDIVGFGLDGVWAALGNGDGTFAPPNMVLCGFDSQTGWRTEKHPRALADLTGDGRADIVGFGDAGVWTALNRGDGTFAPPRFVLADLGYDHEWRVESHPRFVTDLTGDGRADLIGFGDAGTWVALGNGDGTFAQATFTSGDFGYNTGWRVDQHPRFVVDLNGDGKADIVGYGDAGVWVALGNGDGTFQPAGFILAEFGPDHGWQWTKHPRLAADLNDDRCADLVGFGDAGVWKATNHGDGTFASSVFTIAELGYDKGWRVESHPRLTADVTGDGSADIIGFGDAGVWVAVSGGAGAAFVLEGFCVNQGWRVDDHPRMVVDLDGDGKADIIGFGDAGVWIAISNGDGTFAPARFVLADFGFHAGPVVESITIDFHTLDDNLNSESLVHVFVGNRRSNSTTPGGATSFEANLEAYQAHDADWFGRNPYLGCAVNAKRGSAFDDQSTNTVTLQLRSRPIPVEELELPEVNIHILANSDTWKFDYTLTVTLDDGTVLPPFTSTADGLAGIVLTQDSHDYYGICRELGATPARPTPDTDAVLARATIEFNTHDGKNADTTLNVRLVNRVSATQSTDLSVALDLAHGETFDDSTDDGGRTYRLIELPLASPSIGLRDMVLPVAYINIAADEDQWIFDYRMTLYFGGGQPYSWTVSGVVLDQDHHKHMGVYDGRPFETPFCPAAPVVRDHRNNPLTKDVSLAFVARKLDELFNSRQAEGALHPLLKIKVSSSDQIGDLKPSSYWDRQTITNDPPPPNGQPLGPGDVLRTTYTHAISEVAGLRDVVPVLDPGWQFNDLTTSSMAIKVNPDDEQTPITVEIAFETDGPVEVTGTTELDIVNLKLSLRLTLRYRSATEAVDLFGWVDDIAQITDTLVAPGQPGHSNVPTYRMQGTFLGQSIDEISFDPDAFRMSKVEEVVQLHLDTSSAFDPGGVIRQKLVGAIYDACKKDDPGPWSGVSTRDSVNAAVTSLLIGNVIASGHSRPGGYPNPSKLTDARLHDGLLTLSYAYPENRFEDRPPPDWPAAVTPGSLENIEHIIVLMQENRSFDHMLGYLSLPLDKGGMGRTDIDGLKGGESNPYNDRHCVSFPLAAGDTIFTPGPPNNPEMVALQINGGAMDGFVKAQAQEWGPATAHRVMGYHTANNVPTYDALARDFAVGHRWFASHPGPTFPNRFYELTGRPNIDPWGAWEYGNGSPLVPSISETIFEHLSDNGVSWRTFEHGYSFIRRFERYTFDEEHVVSYDDPVQGFLALAASGALPSVSFIEPHYVDYPPESFCDEPPSDIRLSQDFIRRMVEGVVASPAWDKTLLLITYDEHGGFFDHVQPHAAVPVVPGMLPTTGLRVPSFVVSPWVKASAVFGTDDLCFDHTSILKTIARRFLSNSYPYLGARYATAHDLSEVLESEPRPGQFRPFLPYTLVCDASSMCLDVQGGSLTVGGVVWQFTPNGTDAQQFRFEDAGDGFVFIRTLAGLYLTAKAAADGPSEPASVRVSQDRKLAPGSPAGPHDTDRQRWRLASSSVVALDQDHFSVSCAAYPGKVLRPADSSPASQAVVVLAAPTSHPPLASPNAWLVRSHLLSAGGALGTA